MPESFLSNARSMDATLVHQVNKIATGANIHAINNMLGAYRGFVELSEGSQRMAEHAERMERELRMFIRKELTTRWDSV